MRGSICCACDVIGPSNAMSASRLERRRTDTGEPRVDDESGVGLSHLCAPLSSRAPTLSSRAPTLSSRAPTLSSRAQRGIWTLGHCNYLGRGRCGSAAAQIPRFARNDRVGVGARGCLFAFRKSCRQITHSHGAHNDRTNPRSASEPRTIPAADSEAGESRRDAGDNRRPAAESAFAGRSRRQAGSTCRAASPVRSATSNATLISPTPTPIFAPAIPRASD